MRLRDGTDAPFDKRRIQAAVARAQEAAGATDPQAAAEVAELVELALGRRFGSDRGPAGAPPDLEAIGDLVEEALIELGHAAAAKAYILERARESRVRAALSGASASRAGTPAAPRGRAPRVHVADGVESWSRERIVAALLSEADLPRALAEEIAARVEERVLSSGLRRVTTGLIRELVDNELVERGHEQALRLTRSIGLPRHDVARWIQTPAPAPAPGAAGPRDLEQRLAGELLRRWVLEDVLPDALADALLSGEFGVEDLERPHLDLALALPLDLVSARDAGSDEAFALLEGLARAAERTSRAVVLEDCEPLLASLARAQRGAASERVAGWLVALAALARASGRSIDLSARLRLRAGTGATAPWVARVLGDLCALEADGARAGLARLHADAGEIVEAAAADPELERPIELLLARGRLVPTFGSAGERPVGAGLVRGERDRGALSLRAAATLNLPRAARRAGPWREDALFEELHATVGRALDALVALREQRASRGAGPEPRARASDALVPVGLAEALVWMGDGELRPEAGARLLAFLSEAAQRLGAERGLSVRLSGECGERDAARFAALDARRFQVTQPLLFAGAAPAPASPSYGAGFDLRFAGGSPAARTDAAADVLAALSCAELGNPALLKALAVAGEGPTPLLGALGALEHARARRRAGAAPLFVLPRRAAAASLYAEGEPAPAHHDA